MALRFTGGLIVKALNSTPINPCFVVPSSVNLQVRYAARKGYREKARKKHAEAKLAKVPQKEVFRMKQKFSKIERTVEPDKPLPPNDNVYLFNDFKPKRYTFVEAVNLHREFHHPTVFNNPNAPVFARIEFNMTGVKKTQILKPFKGIASIPNPFNLGLKREVLVFCGPEYLEEAIKSGATVAGGTELVAKVKSGYIQPSLYEFVLCHMKFLPELTPIRGILKTNMPRPKAGTLTSDLKYAIPRFLHGIEYSLLKLNPSDDFGIIDCQVGALDMAPEHIEENLQAVLDDIEQFRPKRGGTFVSYICCRCPPSKETFPIDVGRYVKAENVAVLDEDDLEEEEEVEMSEKKELKKILEELEENALEEKLLN